MCVCALTCGSISKAMWIYDGTARLEIVLFDGSIRVDLWWVGEWMTESLRDMCMGISRRTSVSFGPAIMVCRIYGMMHACLCVACVLVAIGPKTRTEIGEIGIVCDIALFNYFCCY